MLQTAPQRAWGWGHSNASSFLQDAGLGVWQQVRGLWENRVPRGGGAVRWAQLPPLLLSVQ